MSGRIIPILDTFDDLAEAIAAPNPRRPVQNAVGQFGRRVCDAISARPNLLAPTVLQSPFKAACEPYWAEQGYSPPGQGAPPFAGGQCAGVLYLVRGTYSWTGGVFCSDGSQINDGDSRNLQEVFGNAGFTGPISELSVFAAPPDCRGAGTTIRISFKANGVQQNGLLTGGGGGNRTYQGVTAAPVFVRVDGGSDCGDPESPPAPGPNPAPDPGPIPDGTGPSVDPDGQPVFILPPDLDLPDSIEGAINAGDINFGGSGITPPGPTEPGVPAESDGSIPPDGAGGDGPAVEGEAPPGKELFGLKLSLVEVLPGAREYGDGIYRAAAYIYMGGPDGLAQDLGGGQVEDGQFFFAPVPRLTLWRVRANVGFKWRVTPYYRTPEK